MNVFILIIVFIFMAGWYLMDSPTQRIEQHGIEYAAKKTEIKSVMTCVAHVQAEAVKLDNYLQIEEPVDIFNDTPCAERYGVQTVKICGDGRRIMPNCIPARPGQSVTHFIISVAPAPDDMGKVLELLSSEWPNNTGFGIVTTLDRRFQMIIGNGTARDIPDSIARELDLEAGQIIYISQYAVTGRAIMATQRRATLVNCPPGQLRVFRFGRWQCVAQSSGRVCTGATIWSDEAGKCIADSSRRPLCSPNQSAVFIDDNWECVNPVLHKECPTGFTAHLDYEIMEWTCVSNPAESIELRNCERMLASRPGMLSGVTTARTGTICTDCEEAKIDPETCEVTCVPAPSKLRACYPGECSGGNAAFYFGFPSQEYITQATQFLPELADVEMPWAPIYSRNRMFNCLVCPDGLIDTANSNHPFTAVCR